ncbi:MAG: efflux RND transporter permease subunit [Deltaproteobacteria bacterium]|nr:efflux RND transporter permease subunit [Deltaproteobacteria bacterium]
MINAIIRYALKHRLTVLILSLLILIYGAWTIRQLPIDVFPDLNRPVVTILTEAHGLAPDEVETLVTIPIESVLSGLSGVVRVRSSSGIGISIIYVEFDWGTDIFRNRQQVAERLQLVTEKLPEEMIPALAPISSIMGEIQFVGLTRVDKNISLKKLRSIADWTVRPRLMTINGISQVVAIGGEVKQYQILVSAAKLQYRGISLEDLRESLSKISLNTTGGFIDISEKEYLIRPLARVQSIEDIENSFVAIHLGKPVLVKDIAEVKVGPKIKRGEGSINGKHAVVLTVQKQPGANTVELTKKIDEELTQLQKTLPQGIKIEKDLFKQAHFIENSISNVEEALRDGAIMVAIILFIFLLNFRTTAITLLAIPLSFAVTAIVFKMMGFSVNTMTLGGLAIAIGELVDDAIVDVENVFRRLKENKTLVHPRPVLQVIYEASSEIRNSIVFSTIIVILVFIPLFALGGIEGRLFVPLGIAYIISLAASLLVSLTVTPVLCSYLLPKSKSVEKADGIVVKFLKKITAFVISHTIHHPYLILTFCLILLGGTLSLIPLMGKNFLPSFNEGTATIGVAAGPGISLKSSDELGTKIEEAILSVPEVKSTVRRTGRAEMDEHAEGVHWHEIDVDFKEGGRERSLVLQDLRKKILAVGDVYVNIGQPISHRLDHLLSGVRAQIAIKIFGTDLSELRRLGGEIQAVLKEIPGVVDLQTEPLVLMPQLKIALDRETAAENRMSSGSIAEDLEIALNGITVSQFIEKQELYEIFLRLDDASRKDPESIKSILIKTLPSGQHVKLQEVAQVYPGTGPNMINRENLLRRIIVSANAQGRDLDTLVKEIKQSINDKVKLPPRYFINYGGQFESQEQASRLIFFLGLLSLLGIFFVLYIHFRSFALTLQIMLNVPLALIGSILAIYLTERILSVATLIAFITLCGIASRNGIMMISHYLHLVKEEGEKFNESMVIRGSLERLVPVLMTALSAILALIPIALSQGEPGKEILYPVAVVIIGGLISSTLLDILVTPAVFYRFGKKAVHRSLSSNKSLTLDSNKGDPI